MPILYLNMVVLGISLNNIQAWMISKEISFPSFYLRHLELPWYFFIVPFFYCFLLHFLQLKEKSNTIVKSLLLIFGAEIVFRTGVIIYCYYIPNAVEFIEGYRQIEEIINLLISFFYLYKSYQIVFKRSREYTYILSFDSLRWLRNFMRLGAVVFLLWIAAIALYIYFKNIKMYYPLRLGTSVLIYWIGYQGLIRYAILKDRIQLRKRIGRTPHSNKTGQSSNSELTVVYRQIESEKLFLNPHISLLDVANACNMSSSKLSKLISTYGTHHFPDLINQYRILHATQLLKDRSFDNYTITAIGLESGFNSKSAFYSAFRKFMEQCPSTYREQR